MTLDTAKREAHRLACERYRRRKGALPRASGAWKAKISGDRSQSKRPEVKAKISATNTAKFIQDPEFRANIATANYHGTEIGYVGAHQRARKALPQECATPDDTCKGPSQVAFRHDAPAEYVRVYDGPDEQHRGRLYFVGPDPADGYMRLCQSHHQRYDRSPSVRLLRDAFRTGQKGGERHVC